MNVLTVHYIAKEIDIHVRKKVFEAAVLHIFTKPTRNEGKCMILNQTIKSMQS